MNPTQDMLLAAKTIGALTIGQSPRPDLVSSLIEQLPDTCQIVEAGALDGLTKTALPPPHHATYPLTTRLRDGSLVMIEETYLASKLQQALDHLEDQGVDMTILLCAGTFANLKGTRPLFKPFNVAREALHALGLNRIGLIAPIQAQEAPLRERWQAAGFQPTVWTADLAQQDERFRQQLAEQIETQHLESVVLDYVGHPAPLVAQLRKTITVPLIDIGQLTITSLAAAL